MTLSIDAEGLQKHFILGRGQAPKRAVDEVTFSIREGERVGFIGRNGAGKTTLLQMLAGIAEPTGGRLDVQGKVTAIFTLGVGLRDDMTGLENIFVEGELQGRSREETQALVDEIVAFADLGPFIDRPVRTYSTGMKARLAFSTIVHIEPEILIVDEALSVGDSRFSAKATAKMRELARKGRILILVSHSMRAIEEMCTRCIWIDAGKVRMDGPPAEVTAAYLEDVRQADEAGLFARFRREVVDQSLQAGWRIETFQLRSGEQIGAASLVTGEPASVEALVEAPPGAPLAACLRLHRLDGLLLLQSTWQDEAQSPAAPATGRRELRIDLGALPLNWGIYKAELEMSSGGTPAARRSVLFEVLNPRPHKGGRPVLVYPATLTVSRLS